LSLNGGTIKNAIGNDASLTLPIPGNPNSLSNNKEIVIDIPPPPPPPNDLVYLVLIISTIIAGAIATIFMGVIIRRRKGLKF